MSDTETRTARCCCGDVRLTVQGAPHYVHGCHCDYCQRRTGSVWQVSCWYFDPQIVSVSGDTQVYVGCSENNEYENPDNGVETNVDYHFCKRCGSTVYWKIPLRAEMTGGELTTVTGVAVGCFTEQDFPKPISNHYVSSRPSWTEELSFKYQCERLPSNVQGGIEMQEAFEEQ